jgi:hypothetical protein
MTAIGMTKTAYVSIANTGNDFIYLNDVTASPDIFSTQLFPFYLFPGGMVTFPVYFTPETTGIFTGEVIITTGDSISQNQTTYTVPLTGNSLLPQPLSFTGVADSNNAVLDWLSPIGGMGDFLQYSAENSATAIGYGDGGTFLAAAKFGSDELMNFSGGEISQIGFIPWTDNAQFTVKLWVGENAEELIASKEVSNLTPLVWNDVFLDFPIPVDTASTVWIGYEVTHIAGEFPAGVDFGPAIEGKGNLLSEDGINWVSLNFFGLDFNWNIRGTVSTGEKSAAVASNTPYIQKSFSNSSFLKAAFLPAVQAPYKAGSYALELSGYNVYRDGEQINSNGLVTESEYIDPALESGIYSYQVTAVYDLGESLPAGPVEVLIESGSNAPEGWEHHQTAMTHIVHIPTDVAETGFMSPGDWIGVFYEDNGTMKSGGALEWTNSDSLKLIVYGDNPATGPKEGFTLGEWMHWKVYMSESGQEFDVEVVYNPFMPNYDGNFNMLGESALNSIQVLTTGINDNQDANVLLYPNPATGQFTLEGIREYSKITIVTAMGMPISEHYISGQDIVRLTPGLSSGLYYVVIKSDSSRVIKKLLFR